MESEYELFEKWYNSHLIVWRRAIRAYFKKKWGDSFILTFTPEIEGEYD